MATILEGLNKLSGALGGAETATENLEALNAIAGALGGETTATNNADAIDQIAEHASGGGGSSDFSTAEVTFINNSTKVCEFDLICVTDDLTAGFNVIQNQTRVVNALFYRDQSMNGYLHSVEGGSAVSMSFSGDIEDDGDGYFIVSGAGTVTITDAS